MVFNGTIPSELARDDLVAQAAEKLTAAQRECKTAERRS